MSAAKMYSQLTLVFGGIRFMRIFVEVRWGGASSDSGIVENGNFQRFRWLLLLHNARIVLALYCYRKSSVRLSVCKVVVPLTYRLD